MTQGKKRKRERKTLESTRGIKMKERELGKKKRKMMKRIEKEKYKKS